MESPSPTEQGGASAASLTESDSPARFFQVGVPGIIALVCAGLVFGLNDSRAIAAAALALMLALLFSKVPVAVALAASGLLGLWSIRGLAVATGTLRNLAYDTTASWSLSVIPMFVFMGLILWRSGITSRLYAAASLSLGWLPGGLAFGTNLAGAGLAAVSGSTVGTTYALARIGVPEMLKAGYDRRIAIGSVMVAGLGGQLIPPSILLVIYAGIAGVAVGPQLLAGVGPGIILAAVFGVGFILLGIVRPGLVGGRRDEAAPRATSREIVQAILSTWPVPFLMVLIVGGLYSGTFTATEAGAASALAAAFIAMFTSKEPERFSRVMQAAVDTVSATASIFFLFIGATIISRMLALSGLTRGLADFISDLGLTPFRFILVLVVVYFVLGMFMDPLAMMLVTVPVLMPIIDVLDISLLWFGVFVVFMGELAVLTPPVGILAFIIHGLVQDKSVNQGQTISLNDTFMSLLWVLPLAVIFLGVLIAFPGIATYIPDLSSQ